LLPGLSLKRWVLLFGVGLLCLSIGLAILLNLQPITWLIEFAHVFATLLPPYLSGTLLLIVGGALLMLSLRRANRNVASAMGGKSIEDLAETLYRQHKLNRGPKVVAIGGGTGLSTLLRGLKHFTANITAVVTVGDDGGSSGILREEQGMIPPGDIRNCIAALADEEELMTALFQYRFKLGTGLEGHSFGNLFITAMSHVTGDILSAIRASANVLNIRGRVLPSTLDNITLIARLADGSVVRGESAIPETKQQVERVWCEPMHPVALPEVITAIQQADLIVMGPGSLFTSVIPNLLIPELAQAVMNSAAPKVYIANMVTQPGETDNMTLGDHVACLQTHMNEAVQGVTEHTDIQTTTQTIIQPIQGVIANESLPQSVLNHYQHYGYQPMVLDVEHPALANVSIMMRSLADTDTASKTLRHDSYKVAKALIQWWKRYLKHSQESRPSASEASTHAS
jgi:uncharacterized cofD-like protein